MDKKKKSQIFDLPELRNRTHVFLDRKGAGKVLASMLGLHRESDAVILAIPAGGLAEAVVAAKDLKLALDLVVVNKITLPWNTEVGYGAVAFDGTVMLNEELLPRLHLTSKEIQQGISKTEEKVYRRMKKLRGDRPMPDLSSRQEPSVTTGKSLFSLLPPAFAAVPQYLFHIPVDLLSLTEPDKRLSHTSGSSVRHSVSLRPTTRVQVFAESGFGPVHPGQSLLEPLPGVCLALALAVEPLEHDACCAIDIVAAPLQIIRNGVIAQVATHFHPRLPEHFPFPQYMSGLPRPLRQLA